MLAGLKWGAIVGVAVYVVGLVLDLFYNSLVAGGGTLDITQRPVLLVPTCLGLFALLFAFSAAGFYTGRETGRAGLGAIAGVVTLIVQYILGLIYTPTAPGVAPTSTSGAGVSGLGLVLADIVSLLLAVGIAACMGWLGGRPGARRSPLAEKLPTALESPLAPPDVPS